MFPSLLLRYCFPRSVLTLSGMLIELSLISGGILLDPGETKGDVDYPSWVRVTLGIGAKRS